jgi:signal transduction histidine kinase/CheY-like chemotaxis protein
MSELAKMTLEELIPERGSRQHVKIYLADHQFKVASLYISTIIILRLMDVILGIYTLQQMLPFFLMFGSITFFIRRRQLNIVKLLISLLAVMLLIMFPLSESFKSVAVTTFLHTIMIPCHALVMTRSFPLAILILAAFSVSLHVVVVPNLMNDFTRMDSQAFEKMLLTLRRLCIDSGITLILGLLTEFQLSRKAITDLLLEKEKLTKLNEDYIQLNQTLIHTVQAKDDLILSVSHELKNPLNVISGNLELAAISGVNQTVSEYIKNAQNGGELLGLLINNLLDAGKLQNNKLEIVKAPTKSSVIINATWETIKILTERKNLKCQLLVAKNFPEVLNLDYHRLIQIVYNLVGNAVKFTSKGGVTVTLSWVSQTECSQGLFTPSVEEDLSPLFGRFASIDCANKRHYSLCNTEEYQSEHNDNSSVPFQYSHQTKYKSLALLNLRTNFYKIDHTNDLKQQAMIFINCSEKRDGFLKLEVKDTGIGLEDSEIPKLFQRFPQVGKHTNKQLGSGLGLWITKNLCLSMEGDIKAYSSKNEGATFVAAIRSISPASIVTPKINPLTQKNMIRALVVDDMATNQEIHKQFLMRCGTEVIDIASNGKEAYDIYKQRGNGFFNIIFMDLDMPVMNGEHASQKIRALEKVCNWTKTVLVIITGHCLKEDEKRLLDANGPVKADYIFIKPFNIQGCHQLMKEIKSRSVGSPEVFV